VSLIDDDCEKPGTEVFEGVEHVKLGNPVLPSWHISGSELPAWQSEISHVRRSMDHLHPTVTPGFRRSNSASFRHMLTSAPIAQKRFPCGVGR